MPTEALQLTTTTSGRGDAEVLAEAILNKRLAACVQISGPIESRYWWNGRLETAAEWLVTIKTRRDLYKPLEALLLELHPYEEPEIIGTAVTEISPGYINWLDQQVSERGASAP